MKNNLRHKFIKKEIIRHCKYGLWFLFGLSSLYLTCVVFSPRNCGSSPVLTGFIRNAWTPGCSSTTRAPTVDTTS